MTVRARTLICLVGAVLAAAALIPIPYLAAPKWEVWVLDEAGVPIEGITVRRVYQNYSTEREDHEEDQVTDKQGYASFPERRSSASSARRCVISSLSARQCCVRELHHRLDRQVRIHEVANHGRTTP